MIPLQQLGKLVDSHALLDQKLALSQRPESKPRNGKGQWRPILDQWEINKKHFQTDGYSYIQVHDVSMDGQVECQQLRNLEKTQAFFSQARPYTKGSTRIISILQDNSWAVLNVSREMLEIALEQENVPTRFGRALASFSGRSMATEEAFAHDPWRQTSLTKPDTFEFGYVLQFCEQRPDKAKTRTSLRRIAVYHRHNHDLDQNTIFLVYPTLETAFFQNLHKILPIERVDSTLDKEAREEVKQLICHPMEIHLRLFYTYWDNWHQYFVEHDKLVSNQYDLIKYLGSKVPLEFEELYTRLNDLAGYDRDLAPVKNALTGTLRSVKLLKEILLMKQHLQGQTISIMDPISHFLDNLDAAILAERDYLEFITSRIRTGSAFLSNIIDLRNQNSSQSMSESMLKYGRTTLDDSTTVRIITVVTMLYLPPTSISGFFSMGAFFALSSTDGPNGSSQTRLTVSQSVWVYFAVAVPLTLATLGIWWWRLKENQRRREVEFKEKSEIV